MDRTLVATELVKVAKDLAALAEPVTAALGRKEFEKHAKVVKAA